jgi:signal transduction histidine kinase
MTPAAFERRGSHLRTLLNQPPAWLLWATGISGLAVGLATVPLLLDNSRVEGGAAFAAIALLICWSFIGAGLVAWQQRPSSRIGVLMIAVGFAWAANGLNLSNQPGLFLAGGIIASVWTVLLFQVLLTFPDGRLRTRTEKRLAAAAWLSGLVLQIPPLLFQTYPDAELCKTCPRNLMLVVDSPTAADLLGLLQALIGVGAMVGLLVLLVRRWQGSSDAQRGTFAPVLWAGGVVMLLMAMQLAGFAFGFNEVASGVIVPLMLVAFLLVPFAFLAGLLRTRLSRDMAVSRLLSRLRELSVEGGELRDLLAEALGDPTLRLGYWFPPVSGYVDQDGRALNLEQEAEGRFLFVVESKDRRIAVLICDPALAGHARLVDAVGAAAALALENERLEAELRGRVADLRASRIRIFEAADAGRRRLERDLHDGAQQQLVATALSLRMARDRLDDDPRAAGELLGQAASDLELATTELRELARGIHPAVLSDRGLDAGLQALADRAPIPVRFTQRTGERFPSRVEAAAYFLVAEALTNVARYANAGEVTVALGRNDGQLEVEVVDDGVGGADPSSGSGLSGLADRVAALDGRFEVVSPAGRGTTVRAVIPCES